MSHSWIKKYEPKTPEAIVGQNTPVMELNNFVLNYKTSKKNACLIYGPPGCGKTSSVVSLAKKHDLEVVEVNASDFRNADQLNKKLGPALSTMSLFSKGKLILIDEVDGLSGRKDRGGIPTIVKLIQSSKFPIICTANNPWDSKFSSLRSKCNVIKFNTPTYLHVHKVLRQILEKENIGYDDTALKSLSRRSAGDMRAAINDIQSLSNSKDGISKSSLEGLSERNKIESMLNALVKIFKNSDPQIALSAFNNVEENLDTCVLWVDENLPLEYSGKDLARAYDALSKADVYRGRIRKKQHWRFLAYVNELVTAGIALAKAEKNRTFNRYKPTSRILKLWRAKMKYQKRNSIAEKIALNSHCSKKVALQNLPFIKQMFDNKDFAEGLSQEFDLNSEELAWLAK